MSHPDECDHIDMCGRDEVFQVMFESVLSYDVASGSEITPCNKIDKPLVVYRFTETL